MKLKSNLFSIASSIIVGGLIGYMGGPVFVLLPWAIIGCLLGLYSPTKKSALCNGAAYGFSIAYSFMLAGYSGTAPITTRLAPFMVLGLVGALGGLVLAYVGWAIKNYIIKHRAKQAAN
jgi:hypothetical protein